MTEQGTDTTRAVRLLATLDSLHLKAFAAETREALGFVILNDTVQLTSYDRAYLIDFGGNQPQVLGVSGQREIKEDAPIIESITHIAKEVKSPHALQEISQSSFRHRLPQWAQLQQSKTNPNVQWVPIFVKDRLRLVLWMERWDNRPWESQEQDALKFLAQGYGIAWQRFAPGFFKRLWKSRGAMIMLLFLASALTFIQLPLRVVAPCEIVAKDPYIVTAPLEGIVAEIHVDPGQWVKSGDSLFSYDRRSVEQAYHVARKQVEIAQAELHRSTTEAFEDEESLAKISQLQLQLKKEQVNLALAKYNVSQLTVEAPKEGVVSIDTPEQWQGKPVQVGERVLTISDPAQTKVRIWIPEDDNVQISPDKAVRVFLNVSPERSKSTTLLYISDHTLVSDTGITSFMAEAEWDDGHEDVKPGLKGTAVLYGESVTLFYWLLRRPWAATRRLIGF